MREDTLQQKQKKAKRMRKMLKEKCGRQNRIRRFNGMTIPRRIFGEILRQAMAHGSVDGKILYSDSTHLGANTNEDKFRKEEVKKSETSSNLV